MIIKSSRFIPPGGVSRSLSTARDSEVDWLSRGRLRPWCLLEWRHSDQLLELHNNNKREQSGRGGNDRRKQDQRLPTLSSRSDVFLNGLFLPRRNICFSILTENNVSTSLFIRILTKLPSRLSAAGELFVYSLDVRASCACFSHKMKKFFKPVYDGGP